MVQINILKQAIDQNWSINRIVNENPFSSWEDVFEYAKPELSDVSDILDEQEKKYGQYYPLKQDIFAAFNYTKLNEVKMVIIGQDPYHQTIHLNGVTMPRAMGLSFSVRQGDVIPSSLQNIYTELENTIRGFKNPGHGDLRQWTQQGVLLLNTCLTVAPGKPGSHGDIWLGFINKVFKAIAVKNPYCIYLLWGREAQKLKPMLGERSVVLEAAHPSGFSATRGFFGCDHFNLANKALIAQGKIGINWGITPLSELNTQTPISKEELYFNIEKISTLTPVNISLFSNIIPSYGTTIFSEKDKSTKGNKSYQYDIPKISNIVI